MFSNFLAASLKLTDGTNDEFTAVFTDEGHLWVRTSEGKVVDLDPAAVATLTAFLAKNRIPSNLS